MLGGLPPPFHSPFDKKTSGQCSGDGGPEMGKSVFSLFQRYDEVSFVHKLCDKPLRSSTRRRGVALGGKTIKLLGLGLARSAAESQPSRGEGKNQERNLEVSPSEKPMAVGLFIPRRQSAIEMAEFRQQQNALLEAEDPTFTSLSDFRRFKQLHIALSAPQSSQEGADSSKPSNPALSSQDSSSEGKRNRTAGQKRKVHSKVLNASRYSADPSPRPPHSAHRSPRPPPSPPRSRHASLRTPTPHLDLISSRSPPLRKAEAASASASARSRPTTSMPKLRAGANTARMVVADRDHPLTHFSRWKMKARKSTANSRTSEADSQSNSNTTASTNAMLQRMPSGDLFLSSKALARKNKRKAANRLPNLVQNLIRNPLDPKSRVRDEMERKSLLKAYSQQMLRKWENVHEEPSKSKAQKDQLLWKIGTVPDYDIEKLQQYFIKDWAQVQLNDIVPSASDRAQVRAILWRHYPKLVMIFHQASSRVNYSSLLGKMGEMSWLNYCKSCRMTDRIITTELLSVIFHRVNVDEEFQDALASSMNLKSDSPSDHLFNRGEWLEALARVARRKYQARFHTKHYSPVVQVSKLLSDHVLPQLDKSTSYHNLRSRLQEESIQRLLKSYARALFAFFVFFIDKGQAVKDATMSPRSYGKFINYLHAMELLASRRAAFSCWGYSQSLLHLDPGLRWNSFVECVCRLGHRRFRSERTTLAASLEEFFRALVDRNSRFDQVILRSSQVTAILKQAAGGD